ncbi:MAG: universal stress protein [Aureliella sp.]
MLNVAGHQPITVSHQGSSVEQALEGAADTLEKTLKRTLRRKDSLFKRRARARSEFTAVDPLLQRGAEIGNQEEFLTLLRPLMGHLRDHATRELRMLQAEAKLADLVAHFQNDTFRSVSAEVLDGGPANVLTEFADEQGTDLIVMGAVGRSALKRVALGSVSDSVANQAQCSVLVVRSQEPTHVSIDYDPCPKRIMLALENSARDVEVVSCLRQFEWPASTQVHAVHVMQTMAFYRKDIIQQTSEMWKQSKAEAESHGKLLAETIRDWGFDARASVISGGHIGESLLSYADEHEYDLIISGDRRRGTLKRLFLGSVSRHLLRYAKCNVLISRGS